jgi:hypothetical protein
MARPQTAGRSTTQLQRPAHGKRAKYMAREILQGGGCTARHAKFYRKEIDKGGRWRGRASTGYGAADGLEGEISPHPLTSPTFFVLNRSRL